MLTSSMRNGTMAVVMTAAILSMPSESKAACRVWDCLFGTSSAPSQTTYAPAYVAPTAYAPTCSTPTCAPTYVSTCTPTCASVVVPSCGTCVPQTCQYTPMVTYRPVFGFGYQTRYVPYTTYRMAYTPIVPYVAYSPCTTCASPCTTCASPCTSCSSPYATYMSSCSTCPSACASGSCGAVSYSQPTSGCASCATSAPSSESSYVPNNTTSVSPNVSPSTPTTPKTFQENKPVTEPGPSLTSPTGPSLAPQPELKPIPQQEPYVAPKPETRLNSTPVPQTIDPQDRTAALPARNITRAELISFPAQRISTNENAGWQASKD